MALNSISLTKLPRGSVHQQPHTCFGNTKFLLPPDILTAVCSHPRPCHTVGSANSKPVILCKSKLVTPGYCLNNSISNLVFFWESCCVYIAPWLISTLAKFKSARYGAARPLQGQAFGHTDGYPQHQQCHMPEHALTSL